MRATADKVLAAEDMREYAIFSLDAQGFVASWNAGAQRIEGYASGEIIGRHFSIFYPPELAASGYPDWELRQAARDGFFIDRGWRVRKDGSRFWAHVVITVQRTPEGTPQGFIKVVRDESEAQARQQRSRRQLSDLFDLASSGIALFDNSGRLLDANGALSDLLGYRLSELREKTDLDLVHPADHGTGGLLPSTSSLPSPGGVGGPIAHRVVARSDGEPVLCQVHSKPSVSEAGGPVWLAIFHDVTEQARHAEELRYQATHDEVTGLLNRRGFEDLLDSLKGAHERVAVFFCDLDNFKRVNDALGHEAGDELLRAVAERLAAASVPGCTAARFYADQFVIACADVDAGGGLEALTGQVTDLFRMVVPLHEWRVHVSATVGATVIEDAATPVTEVLRVAEAAMLEDRVHGQRRPASARGMLLPADTDTEQLKLEQHLREAIGHDSLELHYQPIVDNNGQVVMAEALLRWYHADLGRITPDVVLRVAERGGLLAELDRCLLHKALRESVHWRRPDGHRIGVTVNLTGLHPDQPSFTDEVTSALRAADADPAHLVIEMVETVIAELGPHARRAMTELVDSGVRFAIDDFGTGYSSLARLRELPAQIIKLDRKFVSSVCVDPTDLGITRAVAELANTMSRICVAEGVETPSQHRLLRAVGLDAYQGFLFSAPLPPADFDTFLTTTPVRWTQR
ncbi:putative bifunctional diguanylate cyclase/phosphodiesterase [Saccharopolyspora rosea]|uniref:Bifunctional diguanylate cyclase/phosphodiesterase n=1 Tax=Saccharopolyspora rosea TaxID=524884 RepID=A0ABW3FLI0_9PSEU|nr:EAL domain-containing protein [Saccharopolyspora rosea]